MRVELFQGFYETCPSAGCCFENIDNRGIREGCAALVNLGQLLADIIYIDLSPRLQIGHVEKRAANALFGDFSHKFVVSLTIIREVFLRHLNFALQIVCLDYLRRFRFAVRYILFYIKFAHFFTSTLNFSSYTPSFLRVVTLSSRTLSPYCSKILPTNCGTTDVEHAISAVSVAGLSELVFDTAIP